MKAEKLKTKILRLVLKTSIDGYNCDKSCTNAFANVIDAIDEIEMFDYLVTPGGFLLFEWPVIYQTPVKNQDDAQRMIVPLQRLANKTVLNFWDSLGTRLQTKISKHIKYITFGVDSYNWGDSNIPVQCIQLVALFETAKQKVVHWTGKSYPTTYDQRINLIEILDLESHFVKVSGDIVCLLGCHDLKIFSPRAKATAGEYRQRKMAEFDILMKKYKPNIIIQHPHNTDTHRIWNTEWKVIEKRYPFVIAYASGLRHCNENGSKRETLRDVIKKNFKGSVKSIVAK